MSEATETIYELRHKRLQSEWDAKPEGLSYVGWLEQRLVVDTATLNDERAETARLREHLDASQNMYMNTLTRALRAEDKNAQLWALLESIAECRTITAIDEMVRNMLKARQP